MNFKRNSVRGGYASDHLFHSLFFLVCSLLVAITVSSIAHAAPNSASNYFFENRIPILGIIEAKRSREPKTAELISLGLSIRSGTGQVFVSLDAIHKIDAQVALRTAHHSTCAFLDLPCNQYDFYYAYDLGKRNIIGGQSGSAAIAYLLAKTLRKEVIDPTMLIIGSLAPGAIVARADGIETKIALAQSMGFSSIYIPGNTVCENSAYCDGFRLSHRECVISGTMADGQAKEAQGSIVCPRKRSIGQYALELPACTLDAKQTTLGQASTGRVMTCKQSIGGHDVRLNYNHCVMDCSSTRGCYVHCDAPSVDGFIQVSRVIGLEQILKRAAPPTVQPFAYNNIEKDMKKLADVVCARHDKFQLSATKAGDKTVTTLWAEHSVAKDSVKAAGAHTYALAEACTRRNVVAQTIELQRQHASGLLTPGQFAEMARTTIESTSKELARFSNPAFLRDEVRTLTNVTVYLLLRERSHQLDALINQLNAAVNTLTAGTFIEAARAYAAVTEKVHRLKLWLPLLRHHGTARTMEHDELKTACEQLNQRIQLTLLTLDRFRSARFTARIAAQTAQTRKDSSPALCLYQGTELEAELSVAINFLDMTDDVKKRYLKQFLSVTHSRIKRNAEDGAYPILPFLYYDLARLAADRGDLDAAYLLANTAINFLSTQGLLRHLTSNRVTRTDLFN